MMTEKVCPYYAAVERFPGANPDGRCDRGCSGPSGPACFEFAEPASLHRARMLRIWNRR